MEDNFVFGAVQALIMVIDLKFIIKKCFDIFINVFRAQDKTKVGINYKPKNYFKVNFNY